VNRVEAVELLLDLDGPRPDGAARRRNTLLDHDRAVERMQPKSSLANPFCQDCHPRPIDVSIAGGRRDISWYSLSRVH
jgi:hypothetical protein